MLDKNVVRVAAFAAIKRTKSNLVPSNLQILIDAILLARFMGVSHKIVQIDDVMSLMSQCNGRCAIDSGNTLPLNNFMGNSHKLGQTRPVR